MAYFISGLGPGEAGASKFYSHVNDIAKRKNIKSVFPYEHKSLRRILSKSKIDAMKYVVYVLFKRISFIFRTLTIHGQDVVLAHPQGIGLILSMYIIRRNNFVHYYVLDNSYFCIQSYNFHPQEGECLRCINGNMKPFSTCRSFPGYRLKFIHSYYIKFLKRHTKKIKFFFQNDKQMELFCRHTSGLERHVERIGLQTSDIRSSLQEVCQSLTSECPDSELIINNHSINPPYVVFHGAQHEAKGCGLAFKIAEKLDEYTFIFPFEKPNLSLPKNCVFEPCSWDTGLKELVTHAHCVICPSLWSAPIEAAFIKSILYNGLLIVSHTEYGYSSELPRGLLLDYVDEQSIVEIRRTLIDANRCAQMRADLIHLVKDCMRNTSMEKLFSFNENIETR